PWLVAAGRREAGSLGDFYVALGTDARAARARYNTDHKPPLTTDTHTGYLLPDRDDRLRYRLEAGVRFVRRLEALLPDLVRGSLRGAREHSANRGTFTLGVQVRADHGHETYVAIRITGSVSDDLTTVILDMVPGCDPTGWYPEATMPDRRLGPN